MAAASAAAGIADAAQHLLVVDRRRAHHPEQVVRAGERGRVAPLRLEVARRAHRGPLGRRDHAKEILDSHDFRAADAGNRRFVHRQQLGADGRRPDHPAMQHAVDAKILHVDVPAGEFRGQVGARNAFADNRVVGGVLQRRIGVDLKGKSTAADQLAEPDAGAAAVARAHGASDRLQRSRRALQLLGRERQQVFPRGRRRLPQPHAADADAPAAAGAIPGPA